MNASLKALLNEKATEYNCRNFILHDPISIPHQFTNPLDIEIASFLTCTIAWGQRKTIIANARNLMLRMNDKPYEFVYDFGRSERNKLKGFVHRTFSSDDLIQIVTALRRLYRECNSLEEIFAPQLQHPGDARQAIGIFRDAFFSGPHSLHCEKHVSDPRKGSAAKRINLFLRWMVRRDNAGVDFGLWKTIPMSALSIPLDTHSGNVARNLGLLERKRDDWRAVNELDQQLRIYDASDPVRYDYALFGIGVFAKNDGILP